MVESQSFKKLKEKNLSKFLDLPSVAGSLKQITSPSFALSFLSSVISKFCKNSIYTSTHTHRIYNFQIQGIFVIALF